MGAVHVGVGHDDDPFVAQLVVVVIDAPSAAERLDEIGEVLILPQFLDGSAGHVEDLASEREDRLGLPVARLLCRAARRIALDEENLGALGRCAAAIRKLAGKPDAPRRSLS